VSVDVDRLRAALEDRYAIDREIGRGGMAVVYQATDLKHGRDVAIKVLLPELTASLGAERFLREIETAAKLNHPHILPLHDSGEADGFLFYVMPYVDGESLQVRLDREGALPIDESLQIAREVAGALAYAHRNDVVHRDVKPANVLLSEGHAVIADFGIARAISEAGGERITGTGMMMGSPIYMSPEQVSGEQEVDGRSDIYSLACMLYEMIAGKPPFEGASLQGILARRLVEEPPPLSEAREDTPPGVVEAVMRALATQRRDRYREATDFAAALAGSDGDWTYVGRRSPGRRLGRLAVGALVLIVLGGAGYGIAAWLTRDSTPGGLDGVGAAAALAGAPQVTDLYMQARTLAARRGLALREAIPLFEAAIARDSTFAPAWAGLAEAYGLLPYYTDNPDAALWQHSIDRAEELALAALALDSMMPEAYLALGNAQRDGRRWEAAEETYRAALALNVNYGEAHQQLAELLAGIGRHEEALVSARRGAEIDPGIPVRLNAYGYTLMMERSYPEALEQFERAATMDPNLWFVHMNALWTRLIMGRYDEALASLPDQFWLLDADRDAVALMIQAIVDPEQRESVIGVQTIGAYPVLRALLGDADGTLRDLDRILFNPPYGVVIWVWFEPFDFLREDPRFIDLIERYGTEVSSSEPPDA